MGSRVQIGWQLQDSVVVDRHKDAPAQGKQGASLFAAHDDKPSSEQRCLGVLHGAQRTSASVL